MFAICLFRRWCCRETRPSLVHQPCPVPRHVPGMDIRICASSSVIPPSPISVYRVTDSAAPGGFGRPTGSTELSPGCGLGRDDVRAALRSSNQQFLAKLVAWTSLIVFLSIAKRFEIPIYSFCINKLRSVACTIN